MNHGDWEETREWKVVDVLHQSDRKETPRKKVRKGRGCGCAVVILAVLVVAAAYIFGFLGVFSRDLLPNPSQKTVPVLILGVDKQSREDAGRSDTMILAFLDTKEKHVSLLSIPRDTYTQLPVHGKKDKINAAYAYGGAEAAVEAVNHLLGKDIEHYLVTDFQGFTGIVDILGGITVDVDEEVSKGIDLPPGIQRLEGENALKYVRYRGYPMADIGRIQHQQTFLMAVADELMQPRNIWKLPLLVREMDNVVDSNLTTAELFELGLTFRSLGSGQMKAYLLPGSPQYINGISYWIPDTSEMESLVEALYQGLAPPGQ